MLGLCLDSERELEDTDGAQGLLEATMATWEEEEAEGGFTSRH